MLKSFQLSLDFVRGVKRPPVEKSNRWDAGRTWRGRVKNGALWNSVSSRQSTAGAATISWLMVSGHFFQANLSDAYGSSLLNVRIYSLFFVIYDNKWGIFLGRSDKRSNFRRRHFGFWEVVTTVFHNFLILYGRNVEIHCKNNPQISRQENNC